MSLNIIRSLERQLNKALPHATRSHCCGPASLLQCGVRSARQVPGQCRNLAVMVFVALQLYTKSFQGPSICTLQGYPENLCHPSSDVSPPQRHPPQTPKRSPSSPAPHPQASGAAPAAPRCCPLVARPGQSPAAIRSAGTGPGCLRGPRDALNVA